MDVAQIAREEYARHGFDPQKTTTRWGSDGKEIVEFSDEAITHKFTVDEKRRMSYDGWIYVQEKLCGQGIGGKLVEAREAICQRFGITRIVVGYNRNPKFWEHMGYTPVGFWGKVRLFFSPGIYGAFVLSNPVQKRLEQRPQLPLPQQIPHPAQEYRSI